VGPDEPTLEWRLLDSLAATPAALTRPEPPFTYDAFAAAERRFPRLATADSGKRLLD